MTAHVKPKAIDDFKPRDFRMLIDGVWTEAAGSALERVAPGHGVVVSRYPAGTKADAERARNGAALGDGFLDPRPVLLGRRIEHEGRRRDGGCDNCGNYCGLGHEDRAKYTPKV